MGDLVRNGLLFIVVTFAVTFAIVWTSTERTAAEWAAGDRLRVTAMLAGAVAAGIVVVVAILYLSQFRTSRGVGRPI
jgi:hypothetical protein